MATPAKIAVPRLPLWRLEMMREQAERKADRAREAYDAATAEVHEMLRVIAERRREDRERLMASVDTKAEAAWLAWATPVEMPDLRGFAVPASDEKAP
jgi:hypothetical protein